MPGGHPSRAAHAHFQRPLPYSSACRIPHLQGARRFGNYSFDRIQPIVDRLEQLGQAHGGRTPAQVGRRRAPGERCRREHGTGFLLGAVLHGPQMVAAWPCLTAACPPPAP